MRVILFFLTCFIATLTMLGGLGAKNPLPNYLIAFGLWALYAWYLKGRIRRIRARQRRAYLQEQCMRLYLRQNRYH